MTTITAPNSLSHVLETPAAPPYAAQAHFLGKLQFETDPADVYTDMQHGETGFIVVDTRSAAAFAAGHIPGAMSLPHSTISVEATASLPKDTLIVTYCWGPGCNAATKGAAKLAALGFTVKEMIGGIHAWKDEGYAVEESR
jgi:rhodanese-related sulfurtransferase